MDKSLEKVYRKQVKLQNSWANTIHQCLDAKPKTDEDAALLEYLDRAGFTLDQLRLIILGALAGEYDGADDHDYDNGYADGYRDALNEARAALEALG